jgi:1,2-diacylglycerol-3-alpha-glucose alpha-1,2-galactosyltransferase
MRINVVSESAFTVQGHGVHSAFTDTVDALREYTDYDVMVNSRRASDIVHLHTVGPFALAKLLWAPGRKVVSAHVTPDSFVGSLVGAKYWRGMSALYLRWFYNRADAVVAVSDEVALELKSLGVKRPVYMIPNMIRMASFSATGKDRANARKQLSIPPDSFVVMGCGQVQPRKRIDTFVSAARQVPTAHFIWAGGMPFKRLAADAAGMEHIMTHHPQNVQFTGLISRNDTIKYYQAADLFFMPSIQETFGLVIIEAAAAGLPLLLRDLDVYKSLFAGGYETGTDGIFADIIVKFQTNRQYYDSWHNAALGIAKKYDTKIGAARLAKLYEEVSRQQKRPSLE